VLLDPQRPLGGVSFVSLEVWSPPSAGRSPWEPVGGSNMRTRLCSSGASCWKEDEALSLGGSMNCAEAVVCASFEPHLLAPRPTEMLLGDHRMRLRGIRANIRDSDVLPEREIRIWLYRACAWVMASEGVVVEGFDPALVGIRGRWHAIRRDGGGSAGEVLGRYWASRVMSSKTVSRGAVLAVWLRDHDSMSSIGR
jgi:hypothetical protein